MDGKAKHDYGYQNGGQQPRRYPLTPELQQRLQIEKLPLGKGGKLVEVATNAKLNDELMQPYFAEAVKRQNAQMNGRSYEKKPVGAKVALTPAQERAKHAEQDRELAERIAREGGLREQGLRLAMASRLRAEHWQTDGLCEDLVCTSRESHGSSGLELAAWRYEAQRLLRARRSADGSKLQGYTSKEAYAKYSIESIDVDNDPADDLQQVRLYLCQFLLWPAVPSGIALESDRLAAADQVPERWPVIVPQVLEVWAERLGASVRDTWEDASAAGPARLWLERFLKAHNRRQVAKLAEEMGAASAIVGAKTGAEEVARLMRLHAGGDRLRMPAGLQAKPRGKKGSRA